MHELREDKAERVLIVGLDRGRLHDEINIENSMDELEELVIAANGTVEGRMTQAKETPDVALYLGKGKVEEIAMACDELDIDTVVINSELSGAQIRNLEDKIGRKIIDRTGLILDIFATRATSSEGKLQVELAQLKYRLPRLKGSRDYLSGTGGGIGTRGPGEQKLEMDRRHIQEKITDIQKQLKELDKVRSIKRKKRSNNDIPIIALVGYTNAGKSTLLNSLIKTDEDYSKEKEVFTKNMLFATLETSLRKSTLPNGRDFLITDTVGFVNQLPTHLVEAFKGTLEEVEYADLLLHIVDVTNEDIEIQTVTTKNILADLDVADKPMITVLNKVDQGDIETIAHQIPEPKIFVSAKTGKNLDKLMDMIEEYLPQKYYRVDLLIPYTKGDLLSNLFDNTKVENQSHTEEGTKVTAILDEIDYNKYKEYIVEED